MMSLKASRWRKGAGCYLGDLVDDDQPEEHEASNENNLKYRIYKLEEPAAQPKLKGKEDI
jgi:hypothetical protein